MEVDWDSVFSDQVSRPAGASDADLQRLVETINGPITEEEREWLLSKYSFDPRTWIVPQGKLPQQYLSLLRWSNGGEFRNGERLIQFFPAIDAVHGLRTMMLCYGVPETSPGLLPFAFNGGGIFYAFDMRFRPIDGEYGIVATECGHEHSPYSLESTFLAACQSHINFETAWDEEDEITRPTCDECAEYLVCPQCGKRGPVKH